MSIAPTTTQAPPFDPLAAVLQIGQTAAGAKGGDVGLAASSFTPTGEPISTAILSIGRFILGKSSQSKQEKQARLVASTQRDMGVTQAVGEFIAGAFDPQDPATHNLLRQVEADLSITDIKDTQRGDRVAAIVRNARDVYARQLAEGRALYLPSGGEVPHVPPAEDSLSIARENISGIVFGAVVKLAEEKTGKKKDSIWEEAFGTQANDSNRPQQVDFLAKISGLEGYNDRFQQTAVITAQNQAATGSGGATLAEQIGSIFSSGQQLGSRRSEKDIAVINRQSPAPPVNIGFFVLALVGVGGIMILGAKK